MNETTPTRDEAVPTGWRYSINYGPDGEQNFANVYAADGQFVGNLRTHHAIAICNAFAVCEKLASAPAPASGGVDAVAWRTVSDFVDEMLRDWPGGDDCRMGFGLNGATVTKGQFRAVQAALASLPPAATPVSEAGGEADWNRIARRMQRAGAPGTEEELEAALRAALAKPASSPATEVTMPTEVFNAYRAEMGLPPVDETPTAEGYFWARWLKPAPGTADDGEGCDPERWEVVSVFENSLDTRSEEYLMVMVPGVEQSQPLENFEWGAEVVR